MDHLERLKRQTKAYLWVIIFVTNIVVIAVWLVGAQILSLPPIAVLVILILISGGLAYITANQASSFVLEPLHLLWQAILHVSPGHAKEPAPNLESVKFGRELVTSLSLEVYQLASSSSTNSINQNEGQARAIMNGFPLPFFVINKDMNIVFVNESAQKYLNQNVTEIQNKNIYSVLNLEFPNEDTLDNWLKQVEDKSITATKSWEHVRLKQPDNKTLQFDMAAYYNKDNPNDVELIITLFDHSSDYNADDEGLSYVALAVHELRLPLTLLRGYIEVFEEELDGKLTDELAGFMNKMEVSARQLTSFVNNILNVARVEADQLVLKLNEEKWEDILHAVGKDMGLVAQVHKKEIDYDIAPNLPTVGADRVSIYEVLSNLLDNAIKYSGESQKILVKSYLTKDGLVETLVQDQGAGIPEAVVPTLFEKFSRNHRNRSQVGGTGLGLYLSKAIITAHGGNIWVRSKEGQGTTVGFTLQPYVMVAHKLKSTDNNEQGIVRNAHGWIKNHSMYRR